MAKEIYDQVENLKIEYLFDKVISTELNQEEKIINTLNHKLTCNAFLSLAIILVLAGVSHTATLVENIVVGYTT